MTNDEKKLLKDLVDYNSSLNYYLFQATISDDKNTKNNIVWIAETILKKVYEFNPDSFKMFKSIGE